MPNILLVGFGNKPMGDLIAKIASAVRDHSDLAPKTIITWLGNSVSVSADDTSVQTPYIRIDNTTEEGTDEEMMCLTEILKTFGYDIEWGTIREFFQAPDFERWTSKYATTEEDNHPVLTGFEHTDRGIIAFSDSVPGKHYMTVSRGDVVRILVAPDALSVAPNPLEFRLIDSELWLDYLIDGEVDEFCVGVFSPELQEYKECWVRQLNIVIGAISRNS